MTPDMSWFLLASCAVRLLRHVNGFGASSSWKAPADRG